MRTTFKPCMALALTLTVAACVPLPTLAQVVRCTDPATGQVTYTDGNCRRGEAAREVEARKSAQEIAQERQQATEALERKHERLQLEAQQQRLAQPAERTAHRHIANDPALSAACQQARRQLQDVLSTLGRGMYDEQARLDVAQRQADLACLSPADQARMERERAHRPEHVAPGYGTPVLIVPPRPAPPPPRREIANCNVFRCYDGKGNSYPR